MNHEKLRKTRNHAILKTEKPLGTRLDRRRGVTGRLTGSWTGRKEEGRFSGSKTTNNNNNVYFVVYDSKEKHRIELKKYT